jgi:predicted neutral ceramidase superfamily lipid hydrolase
MLLNNNITDKTRIKPIWIYTVLGIIAIIIPILFLGITGPQIIFAFAVVFVLPYYLITRNLFSDITEQIIIAILLAFALNGVIMSIVGMVVPSLRWSGFITFVLVAFFGFFFKSLADQTKRLAQKIIKPREIHKEARVKEKEKER